MTMKTREEMLQELNEYGVFIDVMRSIGRTISRSLKRDKRCKDTKFVLVSIYTEVKSGLRRCSYISNDKDKDEVIRALEGVLDKLYDEVETLKH